MKTELDEARGAAIDIAKAKADQWIIMLELKECLKWYMETGACSCDIESPCGHCRAREVMRKAEAK